MSKNNPCTNVKFNFDRVSKDLPKSLINDRSLTGRIRDGFNEFKRDATMNDERASVLLSHIDQKKYFVRVKFITRSKMGNRIIRDKFEPILKDKRTVIVRHNSRPGLLTGFDKPYYERSYHVTAVI